MITCKISQMSLAVSTQGLAIHSGGWLGAAERLELLLKRAADSGAEQDIAELLAWFADDEAADLFKLPSVEHGVSDSVWARTASALLSLPDKIGSVCAAASLPFPTVFAPRLYSSALIRWIVRALVADAVASCTAIAANVIDK